VIAARRSYPRASPGVEPPYDYPAYVSTVKRHPLRELVPLSHGVGELTGPTFGGRWCGADVVDLTRPGGQGQALGQRIIVAGRVLDEDGRPVRNTLVEVWQANAAGRYRHDADQHDALDPNFTGAGQAVTDDEGRWRFLTIRPGAYPWRNSENAWRPAHIHFSVFGPSFASRTITQMYFPGDPLLATDPVVQSVPDAAARGRLIAAYDPGLSEAEYALGYRWDIVLRGRDATPAESE